MINEFRPMNHLTSLQNLICTIGNLPTSYALSLSYEEQIWWLCDFLEKKVFPALETNTEITEETQAKFLELKSYVDNYFDNLDVQDEINNKLEEMVESGELQEIISIYLTLNSIVVFNTLLDFKNATNLVNGSTAKILGKNLINDGGYGLYKVVTNNNYIFDDFYFVPLQNNLAGILVTPDIFEQNITHNEYYDETSQTTYYITEIPKKNKYGIDNKLQLGVAEDNYISADDVETTLNFAKRKNASVCINAGLYQRSAGTNKPHGVLIKDGNIIQNELTSENWSILGIKENGSFEVFPSQSTNAQTVLNAGCVNALVGYGFIIHNSIAVPGNENTNPCQVLCRKTNGDYLIFTCDGRTKYDIGMKVSDIQRILSNYNILDAFLLDGGGSTSTVIDLQKINKNIDKQYEDRKNNNFLYISKTDIKNNDLSNAFALIAQLRQDLIKNIIDFHDVWYGYLKLYSNTEYPGIEFYQQNETEERSGKIDLNYNGFHIRQRTGLGENERYLFSATNDHVFFKGLPFGNFTNYCPNDPSNTDFDDITENGFYLATNDSVNTPKAGNFIILHLNTGESLRNRSQFAFPFRNNNGYIYSRRMIDGAPYTDWLPIGVFTSSTANRPTTAITNGIMYFDTTLHKPIWYYNGNWYDATGTQV